MSARQIAALMGVGVVVALHWLTFYASIKLSNASVAVTCMALGSVFTALIEPFAAKRRFAFGEVLLGIATSFISRTDSALLFESLKSDGREAVYARCEGHSTFFCQTGEAAGVAAAMACQSGSSCQKLSAVSSNSAARAGFLRSAIACKA